MIEIITHEMNNLKILEYKYTNIYIFKNLLEDDFCENTVNLIDKLEERNLLQTELKKDEMKQSYNVECSYAELMNIQKNKDFKILADNIENTIFKKIGVILNNVKTLNFPFSSTEDSGYTLRKIYGQTHAHHDGIELLKNNKNYCRGGTVIFLLNSDYQGGIYNFPSFDIKLRLEAGDAIFFPPYWTHPHSVSPVENNTFRYTIHTWLFEPLITKN